MRLAFFAVLMASQAEALDLAGKASSPPPPALAYGVQAVPGWLTMQDGVRLSATYFMPTGAVKGKLFPVLLEMLPYRKDDAFLGRDWPLHSYFAKRGYVSAKVDVRGTGSSEGALPEREYSDAEIADAVEVIRQLAAKPWSNGRVGMWGISWGGFNALMTAMQAPKALKAILAAHASDDLFHDDVHYIDGILHIDEYMLAIDHDNALPRSPDYPLDKAYLRDRFERPPWLLTYLRRQRDGPFWRKRSARFGCSSIRVPAYLIGGLLDSYRDAAARLLDCLPPSSKAVIGPWTHAWPDNGEPGPNFEWRREAVIWFDRWLKEEGAGLQAEPRLRLFMRESHPQDKSLKALPGRWRSADRPLAGSSIEFYPDAQGRLGSVAVPGEVRSLGRPDEGLEAGFYWGEWTGDMRSLDVSSLVFDTPPLEEDIEIAGFPSLRLEAASSAPLAHWVVRLEDVAPDGSSSLVTGGALNGSQRGSRLRPSPLTPARAETFHIPLHFTSWRFPRRHRVRLALTNGLFPMFWPLPEPVEATLRLGERTRLVLPAAPGVPGPEPGLAPPEPREERSDARDLGSRGWPYAVERSRDPATGETVVLWRGENRYEVPSASVSTTLEISYRVHPSKPDQASCRSEARSLLRTKNRELVLVTKTVLASDAGAFRVRIDRRIAKDGTSFARRTWEESIPREFQ